MTTTINFKSEYKANYINWDKDVFPSVEERIALYKAEGVKPSVRGLLYVLESMDILKKSDYGGLSKHLVKWREDGRLPIDCVADDTRQIMDILQFVGYYNYSLSDIKKRELTSSFLNWRGCRVTAEFDEKRQSWVDIITPEEHIQSGINYLNDTIEDLYNHIPRWLDQPNYVEKFVEKNAMAGSIESILNKGDPQSEYTDTPRQVVVVPNKGWTSYTFVRKNLDRLLHQQKMGKEVYVKYYGDSDPSGERMTAEDSKLVRMLNEHHIHFERIAITEDTIEEFDGLEDIKNKELDAETLNKLEKNPNYEWFTKRHEGEVWQIELDALLLDLSKTKELVLSNADKHFDSSIQNEAIEKFKELYPPEDIHKQLKKATKDFYKLLNSRGPSL